MNDVAIFWQNAVISVSSCGAEKSTDRVTQHLAKRQETQVMPYPPLPIEVYTFCRNVPPEGRSPRSPRKISLSAPIPLFDDQETEEIAGIVIFHKAKRCGRFLPVSGPARKAFSAPLL